MRDEYYRCGPVVQWQQGSDLRLLHFPLSGVTRTMDAELGNAFYSWTSFLTPEDAVKRIVTTVPSLCEAEVAAIVLELIETKTLISRAEIVAKGGGLREMDRSRIGWLAIPTCSRAGLLERSVTSYLENMRRFERPCSLLIADDGSPSGLPAFGRFLGNNLSRSHPGWYIGRKERAVFAEHLHAQGDIPAEIIKFGLLGSESSHRTIGANRNAILLHTLGCKVLSADDDTICNPCRVPDTAEKVFVTGHLNPVEEWCFEDPGKCFDFGEATHIDVLGEHEKYLGRQLGNLLLDADRRGVLDSLDLMCPHMIGSLHIGAGAIRTSYNGARGDCGYHSDLRIITNASRSSVGRIALLRQNYDRALRSRQIVRQALASTISHSDFAAIGMCMGIDNREGLPPFVPDCRNSDGVFAQILARCSENNYTAHLPFTIDHQPDEVRVYAANRDLVVRFSDLIVGCVYSWTPEPGKNSQTDRMKSLGRYLGCLGALPADEFDRFLNILMCGRFSSTIELLESVLAEARNTSKYWAIDVLTRIEALREAIRHNDFSVPVDMPASMTAKRRQAQAMVSAYGELLEWWPAILERTTELRNRGITIGRPLNGLTA